MNHIGISWVFFASICDVIYNLLVIIDKSRVCVVSRLISSCELPVDLNEIMHIV